MIDWQLKKKLSMKAYEASKNTTTKHYSDVYGVNDIVFIYKIFVYVSVEHTSTERFHVILLF